MSNVEYVFADSVLFVNGDILSFYMQVPFTAVNYSFPSGRFSVSCRIHAPGLVPYFAAVSRYVVLFYVLYCRQHVDSCVGILAI